MTRLRRFHIVLVAGLLAASGLAIQPAARASSADREFALKFQRPGVQLDPVLSALSAGRLVRHVAALAPGQVDVPSVPLGFALSATQVPGLDVTDTLAGRQEVDAFLRRLEESAPDSRSPGYTVYALPSIEEANNSAAGRGQTPDDLENGGPLASALVVPIGTTVEFVGAVFEGGQLHAKTVVSAAPTPPRSLERHEFSTMAAPSESASFVRAGGIGCLHRKQNNTAWYDPCQEFWQHDDDRDGAKDYFASQLWGTGKSRGIWTLTGLEVFARRTDHTAHQEWVDWDPGADADINCQPQSVEVSYGGASVGISKQHCEMWDISKHADVRFSNWWRGSAWRKERETAMVALTKTNAGELPHQTFDFDYYAQ
ncbi:MAG: hypothetical protein ACRDZ7_05890 [Acidimicrobiia bacterium]